MYARLKVVDWVYTRVGGFGIWTRTHIARTVSTTIRDRVRCIQISTGKPRVNLSLRVRVDDRSVDAIGITAPVIGDDLVWAADKFSIRLARRQDQEREETTPHSRGTRWSRGTHSTPA